MSVSGDRPRTAALAAVVASLVLLVVPALAGGSDVASPAKPKVNFNAILHPISGGPGEGFGLVKFRQPKDADKIVYLGVRVRNLAPNQSYYLQRATDSTVDDVCTGTNWLTLGEGLVPEAIATDENGRGRAALFRDLAAVPLGMEFDIQFRMIDAVTSAVVLESVCHQFAVSQ
jgi:hypothetical protein